MRMDGFVLGAGPAGRCDDYRVGGAVVHRTDDGWLMWYYCRDRAYDRPAPGTLGSGRVALATSRDGIRWKRYDGPDELGSVFAPSGDPTSFDASHVGLTDVTFDGQLWHLWYFGGDLTERASRTALGAVTGLGMRPGHATSPDGVTWTRVPGPATGGALLDYPPDRLYCAWPNVFGDHDGTLYVQTTSPTLDLGSFRTDTFTSTDGVVLTEVGPLVWADGVRQWDEGGIVTRQVLPNPFDGGRRWLMLYTGLDEHHGRSVATADSDDGRHWHHQSDGPVLTAGEPGAWDSLGAAATRLVPVDGRLHLYYYGFSSLADDDSPRGIGLAIADRRPGASFRRVRVPDEQH
ncbi:hypothetical protein Q3V37_14060 [Micromonospora profundi]|uniref:Glycosyl hydrolase n=1 Tax=Micromonospora profundi TaxID=1420889 RepID=A0AAJ6I0L1_9ACTN|nr:hypothetical protein [Micromonospora profundi]WLS48249.1 hypothetical protein Q3V37_14060 [Micromonospora profundi]